MLGKRAVRLGVTDVIVYLLGALILAAVLIGSVSTLLAGKYNARAWTDLIVSGLTLGSIYALIALGYTMVYGILRMINFAHSEVFMSGPYIAYFFADAMGKSGFLNENPVVGILILFIVGVTVSTTVAVLLERIAYRPLRNAPRLVPLITAIGASFFLQYTLFRLFGSNIKVYPNIPALSGAVQSGDFRITLVQLLVIVAAAVMMFALYEFVQRTETGKAIRAVAEDRQVAALMGVDVDQIIVITFVLGGSLAGAAGVLYALYFPQAVSFSMGFIPGIKAFTAAVLGGIGNVPGAMLGGLFLGLVEALGPSLFMNGLGVPAPYQLSDAISFTLLVLVLIFRPTGILGERLAEIRA